MDRQQIYDRTIRHFLAPVRSLLDHPEVTEIMVVGHDRIYFESRGRISPTELKFADEAALRAAVTNIAEFVGRPIGPADPTLDARLPDGSRVHAILPPAARQGVCLTIRRFLRSSFDLNRLIEGGSLSIEAAEFLAGSVRARRNILIAGGTGTGKTSFLNALSSRIPPSERILVIEDSSELQLSQPHTVYLEAQPADDDGLGQLTVRDLFVNALRMRPDRIIVGEVRRGEALDLVQSMISGHPGSMATIHASDPLSAVMRLELLSRMNDLSLPADIARDQVGLAIDLVVQLTRDEGGGRRVTSIAAIQGVDEQRRYRIDELFRSRPTADAPTEAGQFTLQATEHLPGFTSQAPGH